MSIEENPNKFKKMKIADDNPNPIGKERLKRREILIVRARTKIRWQDKKPSRSDNSIERKIII